MNSFRLIPTIIFYLILTVSGVTYAQDSYQPGYIILHSQDTLSGYLKVMDKKKSNTRCEFSLNKDGQDTKMYQPTDILGYRFEAGDFFISKVVTLNDSTHNYFLEYLVKGYANLYTLRTEGTDLYFIEKEEEIYNLVNSEKEVTIDGETYTREAKEYRGVLMYAFSDASDISSELKNAKLYDKSMIRLTKKYHNAVCDEYACIDYTKSFKWQSSVEPSIGIMLTSLRYKSYDDASGQPSKNINWLTDPFEMIYSVKFKSQALFKSNRWGFISGVSYFSQEFTGDYIDPFSIFPEKKIRYAYDIIQTQLGVDFLFSSGKWRPYAALGVNFNIILNPSLVMGNELDENAKTPTTVNIDSNKTQVGIGLKGGLKYFLKRNYLFTEVNFDISRTGHTGPFFNTPFIFQPGVFFGYGISLSK